MPPLKRAVTDILNFPRSPLIAALSSTSISRSPTESLTSLHQDAPPLVDPIHSPLPSLPFPMENPQRAFLGLLKDSSGTTTTLSDVELLHSRAIKVGLARDGQVGPGLLNLYAKCSCLDLAHKLFAEIRERDVFAWTILISGFSRNEEYETGLRLFIRMLTEGILPNRFTLASVLKCCRGSNNLKMGKGIHGWIIRNGVRLDVVLQNSILDFYAKSSTFEYAERVFEMMNERDAISWNIMIGAHLQNGDIDGSMKIFKMSPLCDVSSWNTIINGQMQNRLDMNALQILYHMVEIGPKFNQFTVSMALVLAGKLALLELGRQLHGQILRFGYEHDAFVRNSLIDMYCKCGKIEFSSIIFDSSSQCIDGLMPKTIAWSSMVSGYVQNGRGEEALELFRRMFHEGVKVDQFTLTSIAAACSDAGILEQGRQVHACVEKLGHGFDTFLASAITDMYAKCGSLEDACKTFNSFHSQNVVLWTSIIGSYALHGQGKEAIQLFESMLQDKIMPNEITFVGVLSACSHAGLVEEGYKYFRSMQEDHGIVPDIEHYTCMVDLLGRAGLLEKAKDFIHENNISHHTVVWRTLLSACRVHNNIEMAIQASEQQVRFEPCDPGSYILLSHIHAAKRKWGQAFKLRNLMQERGIRKQPGQSWIQLKNKIHTFVVGDRSHPQTDEIYSYLEYLIGRLKELGYSSRTDLVLHDVEEEQKESALNYHSEKLAIAYGIISTPGGSPLRVMKNLRICVDCHEAIKYVSQATGREIIVRDTYRFHHFKDGKCSCGDYW
ncbi:pentatricopeptide repeat-containing protein At5g04780, mitochondrial-like [Phoenix dactylifera]|uniref:Pentatricopeptide repeat-containing protein At5g04780, mitochondrial-like n=1 Tax=Phoenix dactylifera TaxID=42345 RepID=A0A8B8J6I6_PHODC|nr:pentatricopeptide repeat-containing protein At5g04780, mitochondrial-like [Phoenix dactylifera]